jgi:hypothetical protein
VIEKRFLRKVVKEKNEEIDVKYVVHKIFHCDNKLILGVGEGKKNPGKQVLLRMKRGESKCY